MQYLAHLTGGDVQVSSTIIRDQKTKAITMGTDTPLDQIHPRRQTKRPATVLHQLTITNHGTQTAAQNFTAIIRLYLECADKVFTLHRSPTFFERCNYFIAFRS